MTNELIGNPLEKRIVRSLAQALIEVPEDFDPDQEMILKHDTKILEMMLECVK